MTNIVILLPCLNEEDTVGMCIEEINNTINKLNFNIEIIVVDNGSTDKTIEIAKSYNVKVLDSTVSSRFGYGANIQYGILNSKADILIYADSDFSYPFDEIEKFIKLLIDKSMKIDVVIANRFNKDMEKNAMPLLHKYIGTPILTFIGNLVYDLKVRDIHSGMRGINVNSFKKLNCKCDGMEFAIEMLVQSKKYGLKIVNQNIKFRKDRRNRPPHLNTWSDGWRILKYLIFN